MKMSIIAAGPPAISHCFVGEMSCCSLKVGYYSSSLLPGIRAGRATKDGMQKHQVRLSQGFRHQGGVFVRAGGPSDFLEREEVRWLREEQRWLREEQRWLREEARWNAQRNTWAEESLALNNEIKALKQEIASLQAGKESTPSGSTLSDLMAGLNSLLRSLRDAETFETRISSSQAQIPVTSSSSSSRTLDALTFEDRVPVVASYVRPVEVMPSANVDLASKFYGSKQEPVVILKTGGSATPTSAPVKQRRTMKKGTEGDDVRALQEALAALGFYSGEDEMEASNFATGTERAVKTWQTSVGVDDDGVLTKELLARLFGETRPPASRAPNKQVAPTANASSPSQSPPKGAAIKSKSKETVSYSGPEIDRYNTGSDRRVYLLGENRWEEPSRLVGRNGRGPPDQASAKKKCFECNGVGHTMCTECEGTGELNVEEQFLDWVEDGAKCPYCEGSGAVKCNACQKTSQVV